MTAPGRLVVLSGCSGGGKSTLLAALAKRGFRTVPEPGRRIVDAETASGGSALPWIDLEAFVRRALAMALADRISALGGEGLVFFDRGAIDAASALRHLTGGPALDVFRRMHRYDPHVFLVPPWPDVYVGDAARRHGFDEAVAEYDRLRVDYAALGYRVLLVPRLPIGDRADWVLSQLDGDVRAWG